MSRSFIDIAAFLTGLQLGGIAGPADVVTVARAADRLPATRDANDCAAIFKGVGYPVRAAEGNESGENLTYVCHKGYLVAHNNARHTPDWVMQRLTAASISGGRERPDQDFLPDVPPLDLKDSALPSDYAGSQFDQGHQAPSADYSSSDALMADTFFYSNAVPQVGEGFNRSIWRALENRVRKLATSKGEIVVITGPIYQPAKTKSISSRMDACGRDIAIEPLDRKVICGSKSPCDPAAGVAVPAALFKIVYNPAMGHAAGYLLLNRDHGGDYRDPGAYIRSHQVSIGSIEQLTGYQFFPDMPDIDRNAHILGCGGPMLN